MAKIKRTLKTLQHLLEEVDIPVQVALDGAAEDCLLKIALSDNPDGATPSLEIQCIPVDEEVFANLTLIQFFVPVSEQPLTSNSEFDYHAICEINTELPLGNFGVSPDDILYFRYIHATDANLVRDKQRILNILNLISLIVEVYFPQVTENVRGKK